MAVFAAKVKAVLSADTLILVPPNSSDASKERQLHLAYIQAPRLSLHEAYSYEAREVLRGLLVGKTVKFRVLYTMSGLGDSKREFGDVQTPIFSSLIEYVLAHGGAKVKPDLDIDPEYAEKLVALEKGARSRKLGLWSSKPSSVVVLDLDPHAIEESKKTPIKAIVEKVISGDRILVRIFADAHRHVVAPVLIAGIVSPRSAGNGNPGDPYGLEARLFVEKRLLLQEVGVSILGSSASGILILKVVHPAGNIAEALVSAGLSEVSDWQSSFVGASAMQVLRAAERAAKTAGKGIWKGRELPKSANGVFFPGSEFDAVVSRVMSSDTVYLRVEENEVSVQLASLRAPRVLDETQAAFVPFAKEFVRKKVVGKSVHVVVDGLRPKTEHYEERPMVSLYLKDRKLLSQIIVAAGWAGVIRHKRGDENKSSEWDLLVEAEKDAIQNKRGIHGKLPPAHKMIDASENASKAKTFLTSFLGRSHIPAVVDHVVSSQRYRLILPKENVRLSLVLGGLANRAANKDSKLDAAALDFASRRTLQRDVTVDIYHADKVGGFIGNLYLPGHNTPFQSELLERGLAEIHDFSVEQTRYGAVLLDAQELAQKNRLGIWRHIEEPTPEVAFTPEYLDVEVNDVSEDGHIAYQLCNSESELLVGFMKHFHEFHQKQPMKNALDVALSAYPRDLVRAPKKGDLVSVAFLQNGKYYRGKVLGFDKQTRLFKVQHVDFGNIDEVQSSAFRQLPPQFSLEKFPAQGHVGVFALARLPTDAGYKSDALEFLDLEVLGKKLVALSHRKSLEAGVEVVFTLYDPEKTKKDPKYSITREMVEKGLAVVTKDDGDMKQERAVLRDLQEKAKRQRLGCWEFGDAEEENEE